MDILLAILLGVVLGFALFGLECVVLIYLDVISSNRR
jgi:hypothetical protein